MGLWIASSDSVFYDYNRRLTGDGKFCARTSTQHNWVFSDYTKDYTLFHTWGLRRPHITVFSGDLKPYASKD